MEQTVSENLFGQLSVISMRGCEEFCSAVDKYLKRSRNTDRSFLVSAECPRFGTGEGKGLVHESLRGHDVYIISDPFNHGVIYCMYGKEVPMSPDDHFADLKRVIGAIAGKARRISVIMPMLYEGRQHKRSSRESLDCALMLQELHNMGVANIITFDAHDARVQNAIPLGGFDNVQATYQMIKALVKNETDISINKDDIMIVSPDEGGMHRCMYYSSVLKLDLGMFYKRRNYSVVVDGRNPIEAHEYLGRSVKGKDVIIVDDMISSGDSVIEIGKKLKERGAKRIFVFATFGLFSAGLDVFDKAYEEGSINRVYTTNLIYRVPELAVREWYIEVNMCKYISLIVDTLNRDQTISSLLSPSERIQTFIERRVADGTIRR